jgi:hypothetical protein
MFKEIGLDNIQKLSHCKNCRRNEKAQEPFSNMVPIELMPLSQKVIEGTAKKYGVKESSCLICLAIDNFSKLPVNQQLDFLKGKN